MAILDFTDVKNVMEGRGGKEGRKGPGSVFYVDSTDLITHCPPPPPRLSLVKIF